MTTRTLAVVSAGLSVPSSTRLLADRLTAATVDALRRHGVETTVEVPATWPTTCAGRTSSSLPPGSPGWSPRTW